MTSVSQQSTESSTPAAKNVTKSNKKNATKDVDATTDASSSSTATVTVAKDVSETATVPTEASASAPAAAVPTTSAQTTPESKSSAGSPFLKVLQDYYRDVDSAKQVNMLLKQYLDRFVAIELADALLKSGSNVYSSIGNMSNAAFEAMSSNPDVVACLETIVYRAPTKIDFSATFSTEGVNGIIRQLAKLAEDTVKGKVVSIQSNLATVKHPSFGGKQTRFSAYIGTSPNTHKGVINLHVHVFALPLLHV
jgi:hypothetical protein